MHWRWKPNLADVLIDSETDQSIDPKLAGTPYLVPGQTIDIGIVQFKPGEQPPMVVNNADPLSLVSGETIFGELSISLQFVVLVLINVKINKVKLGIKTSKPNNM